MWAQSRKNKTCGALFLSIDDLFDVSRGEVIALSTGGFVQDWRIELVVALISNLCTGRVYMLAIMFVSTAMSEFVSGIKQKHGLSFQN